MIQKLGAKGIAFLVMLLLARLLTPKDFGLIGMLMIFIQLSQALIDGGFNSALIQKKNVDEEDYTTVFYINLSVSILLYITLFFCAPLIADFYHQPLLTSLCRVLSLIFIINAFSYVQEARLNREIRFKTLMIIHIPSTVAGGVASIILAILGFGVWSIVAMQLITRLAFTVQMWIYAKWRPTLTFERRRAISLFSFGSKLMVSGIISTIYNNIFLVIIGKFFPVKSVGYYQNAFGSATIPSSTITSVLYSVTFPVFSSIQDDNKRLKSGYRRIMEQIFFWICPLYVLSGILARPLFAFAFTDKWLPAAPYFQLLCVVAIFEPLNTFNLNITNVKGRSDVWLKLQFIRRLVTVIAIVFVIPFGIMPLLAVQALSSFGTFLFFSHFSGRYINFSLKDQLIAILPILLLSLGIGALVFVTDYFISDLANFVRLIVGFGLGGVLYLLIAKMIRLTPYVDFHVALDEKVLGKLANRKGIRAVNEVLEHKADVS